jgi:integrative and conjugative element protein (TIGR02256 family)
MDGMSQARIRLPERVLVAMRREAERHYPAESGGVLLGYLDPEDSKHIQVLKQVGPGPKALHKSHRFEPDGAWQERRIAAAYRNSDTLVRYLGDWHSHPNGGSRPSGLDRSTAAKIASTPQAQTPHPLTVILHGRPDEWEIAAYRFGRRRLRPAKLRLVDRR